MLLPLGQFLFVLALWGLALAWRRSPFSYLTSEAEAVEVEFGKKRAATIEMMRLDNKELKQTTSERRHSKCRRLMRSSKIG